LNSDPLVPNSAAARRLSDTEEFQVIRRGSVHAGFTHCVTAPHLYPSDTLRQHAKRVGTQGSRHKLRHKIPPAGLGSPTPGWSELSGSNTRGVNADAFALVEALRKKFYLFFLGPPATWSELVWRPTRSARALHRVAERSDGHL
jgi:hypothetical protein